MLCVVRWFSQQEGPSSCPCCRREAGELDNLPMAEDEDAEDLEDEEDNDSDEDDNEDDELENIEMVWVRTADGTWARYWRESVAPLTWKPTDASAPETLIEPIASIQALWRGHTVRSDMAAATALLTLKDAK